MRKDLRSHVELQIQSERLPVRCTTEKTDIPHALICTENSADYVRRANRYEKDIESMGTLLPTAPPVRFSWAGEVERRLRLAIARCGCFGSGQVALKFRGTCGGSQRDVFGAGRRSAPR
ncbi:MAG: hypothetical protein OXN97_04935 [Bryobacterales bacterium]|nr:hypothetical protein [Bryobacterales bacterium]MDE0627746.1 hypothetical protein [Bryobacterales bacterium]